MIICVYVYLLIVTFYLVVLIDVSVRQGVKTDVF